ncbi:hypothetical protein OESDEN_20829 [Oesophagostomum dentatum]|uniref:Uncharacterized protein n=1 Tax=Oesophagostomum dentatum TaxID=61180 RepID=A0A0B1S7N5_OESDE|nr:hypothetical protein OESDEN_20829 [Oesophagostomum dentatum]
MRNIIETFCEVIQMPGLLKRLAVLWTMWFVASFCAYGNDLNSNTIYGNLFVNQILFAVLITISKWVLLTVDTWYPAFSRRKLHQGAQVVVCTCFLILSILTMKNYRVSRYKTLLFAFLALIGPSLRGTAKKGIIKLLVYRWKNH